MKRFSSDLIQIEQPRRNMKMQGDIERKRILACYNWRRCRADLSPFFSKLRAAISEQNDSYWYRIADTIGLSCDICKSYQRCSERSEAPLPSDQNSQTNLCFLQTSAPDARMTVFPIYVLWTTDVLILPNGNGKKVRLTKAGSHIIG